MANRVAVTRVTIEYVCEGRTFSVVFNDPSTIDSIVLGSRDLHRLRSKQAELAERNPPQAPKVVTHRFDPLASLNDLAVDGNSLLISSREGETAGGGAALAPASGGRSLWWHSAGCVWFHPEGDE